jgi:hypothetical protein
MPGVRGDFLSIECRCLALAARTWRAVAEVHFVDRATEARASAIALSVSRSRRETATIATNVGAVRGGESVESD